MTGSSEPIGGLSVEFAASSPSDRPVDDPSTVREPRARAGQVPDENRIGLDLPSDEDRCSPRPCVAEPGARSGVRKDLPIDADAHGIGLHGAGRDRVFAIQIDAGGGLFEAIDAPLRGLEIARSDHLSTAGGTAIDRSASRVPEDSHVRAKPASTDGGGICAANDEEAVPSSRPIPGRSTSEAGAELGLGVKGKIGNDGTARLAQGIVPDHTAAETTNGPDAHDTEPAERSSLVGGDAGAVFASTRPIEATDASGGIAAEQGAEPRFVGGDADGIARADMRAGELGEPDILGSVVMVQGLTHRARTVAFDTTLENPVLFASPLTLEGWNPATVRFTGIEGGSATLFVDEPDYLADGGAHKPEDVALLALQEGLWALPNGGRLEVGRIKTDLTISEGFVRVDFTEAFDDTPVVMAQVQTDWGSDWVVVRLDGVTREGFSLSLQEVEAKRFTGHGNEIVGWLAMDEGVLDWDGLLVEAFRTGPAVNHLASPVDFAAAFATAPLVTAGIASTIGPDTVTLRLPRVTAERATFLAQEEISFDTEVRHTAEVVAGLAFSGEALLAGWRYEVSDIPGDPTTDAALTIGGEARSTIGFAGDEDWFRVGLSAGQSYAFDLAGDPLSSNALCDPFLRLYDETGNLLVSNDDVTGLDARITYRAPTDGDVFVSAGGFAWHTGDYVLRATEQPVGPVLLHDVPAYDWYHGCSPTTAGSLMGYWDLQGYANLFDAEGWDAVSRTDNVQDHISSPAHNEKYDPSPDDPSLPVPPTTSIAGFMGTSVDPLDYGHTWANRIPAGQEDYAAYRGYEFVSWNHWGQNWDLLVQEIDAGRPVHLMVDSDADGSLDHSVPGIGYEDRGNDGLWYALYTSWSESETPRWYEFQAPGPGVPWGVASIGPVQPAATGLAPPTIDAPEIAMQSWDYEALGREGVLARIEQALASDGLFDEADAKIFAQAQLIDFGVPTDDPMIA